MPDLLNWYLECLHKNLCFFYTKLMMSPPLQKGLKALKLCYKSAPHLHAQWIKNSQLMYSKENRIQRIKYDSYLLSSILTKIKTCRSKNLKLWQQVNKRKLNQVMYSLLHVAQRIEIEITAIHNFISTKSSTEWLFLKTAKNYLITCSAPLPKLWGPLKCYA